MNPAIDPSPDSFGPYEVYERLGMGGMAMVHRAKKRGIEGFERSVALKRMLQHLAEDANFVDSFIREAKVASLLQHPNVAQVYDFGRIGGVYYIAMELVTGFDVRKILRYASKTGEPIPLAVVLSIIGELADALEYAHNFHDEQGTALKIVHRDISPSNLIVAHTGHLKVIDFGIAKANSRQLQTESGQIKGKLGYMSPEAAHGMQLDPVSDIFSMGVVAWELVTASPLFSARTDYETMRRIREAEITPPSYHNPACPPELDSIIVSALDREPSRRLPSAAVFRAAIDALATQHGIHISARNVAEWMTRFAQPGDAWARPSTSARQQLPLPAEQPTSVLRVRSPSAHGKLQRSAEQAKLAGEIWGDDAPPMSSTAAGPDFSVPVSRASPTQPPPLPQPLPLLSQVPMYTPTGPVAPKPNRKPVIILATLAIVAGVLAGALIMKKTNSTPDAVAAKGPLRFVVEPAGAIIEIAGKEVSRESPFATELDPGVYQVTVRDDGFKPWTNAITVRASDSQTINVALERGTAKVSIDSDPPGLSIAIDGKPSGHKTPANFDVPAGSYKLSVMGPTGEVWTEDLVASVDGNHAFTAMLATKTPPTPAGHPPAETVAEVNKPATTRKPQVASNDRNDRNDRKPPKSVEVEPVKPPEPPEPPAQPVKVKPPEPPPNVTPKPPEKPARTPVVASSAVTKLSGDIPTIKTTSGESNGDVLVKMCIDDGGKVTSVKVVKSSAASIAGDLTRALSAWRYKPYLNRDKQASPVCFPVALRLVFKRGD